MKHAPIVLTDKCVFISFGLNAHAYGRSLVGLFDIVVCQFFLRLIFFTVNFFYGRSLVGRFDIELCQFCPTYTQHTNRVRTLARYAYAYSTALHTYGRSLVGLFVIEVGLCCPNPLTLARYAYSTAPNVVYLLMYYWRP